MSPGRDGTIAGNKDVPATGMPLLLGIPLRDGKRGAIAQRYPTRRPQPTGGPRQPQPVACDRAGKN